MKAWYLQIFSDSQLVVKQVTEECQARGEKMVAYLKSAQVLLKSFDKYNIVQVPRANNTYADALAHLASTKEANLNGLIPVEHLAQPSIKEEGVHEQETNELANSEHSISKLTACELAPDNLELPAEANLKLAPYEQTYNGEVNLTQPPPQLNEFNLEAKVLQTQHQQTWMDPLVDYLRDEVLPTNKNEARSIHSDLLDTSSTKISCIRVAISPAAPMCDQRGSNLHNEGDPRGRM